MLLLLAAAGVARGLYLLEPPGSDQGLFMAEADLVSHGARLYDDVWEHKPPGIVALYAVALRLLGRDYLSIKLLHGLAVLCTATMLLGLSMRAGLARSAAMFGALLYLAFFSGPVFGGFWSVAQAESFLDPLLCLGLWLVWLPEPTNPPAIARCFWAGVAIGIAVATIKYSALPWLAIALLCLRARKHGALAFAAGCALPALCLFSYFAATGRARSWFDATVVFNLEHQSVGTSRFWDHPVDKIFLDIPSLLVVYAFGSVALAARARARTRDPADRWFDVGLRLWLLAFMQVLVQRKFWAYHYQVLVLPLAIVASVGFQRCLNAVSQRLGERRASWICVLAAGALSIGYGQRCLDYIDQHAIVTAITGRMSRDEYYRSYSWGVSYAMERAVADQVAKQTAPTDRILVWTFEPLIYFLSSRKPATRFLYDYPITLHASSLHVKHIGLFMNDIGAHPPLLILARSDDRNSLEREDSITQLTAIPELKRYVAQYYVPSWTAGDFVCFVRRPE